MKTIISLIICAAFLSVIIDTEKGEIKGTAHTENPNESVPFATVSLSMDSIVIMNTVCDFEGKFILKSIPEGTYSLKAGAVGYKPVVISNIVIAEGKVTNLDIKLEKGSELSEITVIEYRKPLDSDTSRSAISKEHKTLKLEEVKSKGFANTYNVDGISGLACRMSPMPQSHEEYDLINENKYYEVASNPLSTFSIDVDAASYSNMRRFIMDGSLPPKDAVRIEEMINYFSYNYPQPVGPAPFSITTEISNCPWNEKHRLIHIGLNGKDIPTENLPDNNLVFLIDVSGSMSDANKLPLLKNLFNY